MTPTPLTLRQGTAADAEGILALVTAHLDEGHLLPRALEELRVHAHRFIVCDDAGQLAACAELAPLSGKVAEVRSLVVSRDFRSVGLGHRLVAELRARARTLGFDTLTAFTHDARFFVRQGFSIVPHVWVPEKIMTDCVGCPLFRKCEQYAVVLPLQAQQMYGAARSQVTARVA
jgi:N-acetylglutamate synthase-like GNAT family acetyltransferase